MIVQAFTAEDADMSLAKEIGEMLHTTYPGHLWAIEINGGCVVIKALNISSMWGMVIHQDKIMHDAAARKKKVLNFAGEFLERARLKRGRWNGDFAPTLDGASNFGPVQ
jgi:hypothetical protein